jgi:hypothetical protein
MSINAKRASSLLFLCSVFITSCSESSKKGPEAVSASNSSRNEGISEKLVPEAVGILPANLYKVLDRVSCDERYPSCSQKMLDSISEACTSKGYITNLPANAKVRSSRNIEEMVTGVVYVPWTTYEEKEIIDENGVVSIERTPYNYQKESKQFGYCIGSEYVTE